MLSYRKALATVLLLILLYAIAVSYTTNVELNTFDRIATKLLNDVKNDEWLFIETMILENNDKAKTQAEFIKGNIVVKIKEEYKEDYAKLLFDLENPNVSAKVYKVFSDEIKGRYLNNIKNDNNDPFVGSSIGIYSDQSLNCAVVRDENNFESIDIRSWETEISLHWNSALAKTAISHIIDRKSDNIIFWEFLKPKTDYHTMLASISVKDLKSVFMQEGLDGLSSYEFLGVAYIYEDTDIFGKQDVNNLGRRQKNNKIIVVQGFNVVDVIEKNHSVKLSYFEEKRRSIIKEVEARKVDKTMVFVLHILMLFSLFISIAFIINKHNSDCDYDGGEVVADVVDSNNK